MTIWQLNAGCELVTSSESKPVTAEQVAVLTERVNTMLNGYSELRGIILGIATAQAVHVEKLSASDAASERIFSMLDRFDGRITTVANSVNIHSWTWKLIGSCSFVAVALTGWAFGELRELQRLGNDRDKRITIIEFVIGGRSPYAPIPKQPETTSK